MRFQTHKTAFLQIKSMLLLCIQLKFKLLKCIVETKNTKLHHKSQINALCSNSYLIKSHYTALKPRSQKYSDCMLRGGKLLDKRGFNLALFLSQSFHIISEDLEYSAQVACTTKLCFKTFLFVFYCFLQNHEV